MRRTPAPMGVVRLTSWKRVGRLMMLMKKGKPVRRVLLLDLVGGVWKGERTYRSVKAMTRLVNSRVDRMGLMEDVECLVVRNQIQRAKPTQHKADTVRVVTISGELHAYVMDPACSSAKTSKSEPLSKSKAPK